MPRSSPEYALQCQVVEWVRYQYPADLIEANADANGLPSNAISVSKAKKAGMAPGAPDLVFMGAGKQVMWMELKAPGGRLSPAQKAWIDRRRAQGHVAHVCDSFEAAQAAIKAFAAECSIAQAQGRAQ